MKNILILVLLVVVILLGYRTYKTKDTVTNTPIITQAQAESLVKTQWGDIEPGERGTLSVTVDNNVVTAIYPQADDSVKAIKKVATVTYQNSIWTLNQPVETQSCHQGRGHQDFSTEPCI
jgi:hypothetical protein